MKTNIFKTMALAIFTIAACNTTHIAARGRHSRESYPVNTNAYTQLATNLSTATTAMQKAQAWRNFRITTSTQKDHLSTNEILRQAMQLHDNKTLSDEQFTRILGAFENLYRLHKNSKGEWYFDKNGTQTKLS